MSTAETWHHIDTHPVLTAADGEVVWHAISAAHELDNMLRAMPATLASMRDCMNGQPRAANYQASHAAPTAWCWDHERELHRCIVDGWDCAGDVIDQPSDPSGEAAITPDAAQHHRTETIRLLRQVARDVQALSAVTTLYPSDPCEPAKPDGPGVDWCTSCWRDGKYHQPITLDPDGKAYYTGLCRWCGDFKARERFLPPVEILNHRHRGERVTEGMIAEARKTHKPLPKVKAKKQKKSKLRKKGWLRALTCTIRVSGPRRLHDYVDWRPSARLRGAA